MRRPCTILALLVAALASGCAQETIHHGDPDLNSEGFASISVGGEASGPFDGGPNIDGNYPDPAVTRCGDVLGDLPAIDGLASAWALVAVPGATARASLHCARNSASLYPLLEAKRLE